MKKELGGWVRLASSLLEKRRLQPLVIELVDEPPQELCDRASNGKRCRESVDRREPATVSGVLLHVGDGRCEVLDEAFGDAGFRVTEVSGGLALRGKFFGASSRQLIVLAEKKPLTP